MSSRCLAGSAAALLAALALAGCEREARAARAAPASEPNPNVDVSPLHPGNSPGPAADPRAREYEANAWQVSQGQRLFSQMNCSGCHSGGGGGGMGPALIDSVWIYGNSIEQIYATIRDGRPNGMPAWGQRLTDQQVWQLAAYVRALSGNASGVASSRSDHMMGGPPANQAEDPEAQTQGQVTPGPAGPATPTSTPGVGPGGASPTVAVQGVPASPGPNVGRRTTVDR